MKYLLTLVLLCSLNAYAQKNNKNFNRPKLMVGLVIDQMRYDFLYRYYDRYEDGGFKRLMQNGNNCENMFINYLPSYTAPGHTCIFTGSVPALHGIASNDWIDKITGNDVYCTDDASVTSVGGTQRAGKMSPKNLLVSTITDELRLATNFKSKTIAISVKDRASILPGGHTANAAYWMDDSNGVFMTSSFYTKELPSWVATFNNKNIAKQYMDQNWATLFPIETYTQSTNDNNAYEGKFSGETSTNFPHLTSKLKLSDIKKTPYGNSIVFDFAKEAIVNEKLGLGEITDFLSISCSSPDYIGHQFGPNSIEVEDAYLRLDRDIASFLNYLDDQVGEGNYTLFLTADHGVAHNPQFLKDKKIPAGFSFSSKLRDELNTFLNAKYKSNRLIKQVGENFVWLNHTVADSLKLDESVIKKDILKTLSFHDEIQFAIDMDQIQNAILPTTLKEMAINGYNSKRSGDILLLLNPGWFDAYATTGTTHGTWNPYDTHIPMLWFGWGINKGTTKRNVNMTDIAATIATLLHIQMPNGCIGSCITEVVK
ncbi:MAG TPA: alkaline phosphatase family protein [Chitinophagaceae bacterium]|nr:alkaline phosphatase family protein [Chitinophagaceae bacterium]